MKIILRFDEIPPDLAEFFEPVQAGELTDVFTMSTAQTSENHYASFPESLPRKCILASTSERGNCPKCGKPFVRVVKQERTYSPGGDKSRAIVNVGAGHGYYGGGEYRGISSLETETIGWRASCNCGEQPSPAIVLDPFCGTGTTGKVAKELGRRAILIDLSQEYCEIAKRKIESVSLPLDFHRDIEREDKPVQLVLPMSMV